MKLIHTVQELRTELNAQRLAGKKIGFVPTMGALHEGHASLVRRAVAENEIVVVSDFVNPTQFNDKNDLLKYPRTLEADCELLEKEGAAYVFAPSVEEVYPEPDKADFGEKDFQQLAIIREMVKQMNFPLEIVGCPIVREADGLALSSRNARLSEEERQQALNISKTLFASKEYAASHTVEETQKFVEDSIAASDGLELEYFELVDGTTLQKISTWDETNYAVGCITVYCGEVRLIDNIKYKEQC